MRKLTFTVGADSVSPESIQYGGIQGEHNATEIEIALDADIRTELSLAAEGGAVYRRIDAEDGAGAHFIGQVDEYVGEETITYSLPQSVTAAGGNIELRLIFSVLADGETEKVLYSYAMKLRLDSSFYGDEAEASAVSDLSAIAMQAVRAAQDADDCAERAENALTDIETGLKSKVDKSQIVSEITGPYQIPNGDALTGYVLDTSVVYYTTQSLTDEQKARARSNIDTVSQTELSEGLSEKLSKSDVDTALDSTSENPVQNKAITDVITNLWSELGNTATSDIVSKCVNTGLEQNFTDEEKALARSNIGAVSTGDVVNNCVSNGQLLSEKIPNAGAMYEFLKSFAVLANTIQSLSDARKARARENIDAVKKDTYELIESIATEEECQQITRTAEPDGTVYAFTKCLLRVSIPATTSAATLTMNISTSGGAWLAGYFKSAATRTDKTTYYLLEAYQADGIWKDRSDCNNTYGSATMTVKSTDTESYSTIGKVSISLSTTGVNLPVGTTIDIYGVRA